MATSTTNTRDWKFNQIGIRVTNLEKSLWFYQTVLGMKELTRTPSDTVTIVLLGYPDDHAPENVLYRQGVLELAYVERPHGKKLVTNTTHNSEYGVIKLTFTVPDMTAALNRIREYNIPILKEPGASKGAELAAQALGTSADRGRNKEIWQFVDIVAFVEDPDEYLIELIQY